MTGPPPSTSGRRRRSSRRRRPDANPHADTSDSNLKIIKERHGWSSGKARLRQDNPTQNPTHQHVLHRPIHLNTTRLPGISRPVRLELLIATSRNPLLINRFRVQVPAGAPNVDILYGLMHPNGRADWAMG